MTSDEALGILYSKADTTNECWECRQIIEKDLIALDIIKKRQIDVKDITDTTDDYELYQAYCEGKGYADEYICTEDEFKLLREVL